MEIIIGAGTSGLSAGRIFNDYDKEYLILDAKEEIGKPIRSTGAVSKHFIQKLGMPFNWNIIAAKISSAKLTNDDGKYTLLRFDEPVGYLYDFTEYEKFLGRGLNIQLNERVTSIDGNIVRTEGGRYEADNVIIATGTNQKFSHHDSLMNSYQPLIMGYQETRKLPKRSDSDLVVWFSNYAQGGYIWDFPGNRETRKIGIVLAMNNGISPKNRLREFTRLHEELDGKVEQIISHRLSVGVPPANVVFKNRLYVGDAARSCFATTGGGLQGAFWSGKEAALSIVSGDAKGYQNFWDNELRPLLNKHYRIARLMYRNGTKKFNSLLEGMNGYVMGGRSNATEIYGLLKHVAIHKPSKLFTIMRILTSRILTAEF